MNYGFDNLGTEFECLDHNYECKITKDTISVIHKKDKTILGEQEALDKHIIEKYNRAFYMYSIHDANIIMFNIKRQTKSVSNNLATMIDTYNEITFEPQEIISDINDNKYRLSAIITDNDLNYQLFFTYSVNGHKYIWINYDSKFNTETRKDFLEEIGSFSNLLGYNNEYVKQRGIIYIYTTI